MGEHPPKKVWDTLHAGDREAFKRMSAAGGKKAAEKREQLRKQRLAAQQEEEDIRAASDAEKIREAAEEQAKLYQVSSEGDVVAPDILVPFKIKPPEDKEK